MLFVSFLGVAVQRYLGVIAVCSLRKKAWLQGVHIDALACSYCVNFIQIKNCAYPVSLVIDNKKIPAQENHGREPRHK